MGSCGAHSELNRNSVFLNTRTIDVFKVGALVRHGITLNIVLSLFLREENSRDSLLNKYCKGLYRQFQMQLRKQRILPFPCFIKIQSLSADKSYLKQILSHTLLPRCLTDAQLLFQTLVRVPFNKIAFLLPNYSVSLYYKSLLLNLKTTTTTKKTPWKKKKNLTCKLHCYLSPKVFPPWWVLLLYFILTGLQKQGGTIYIFILKASVGYKLVKFKLQPFFFFLSSRYFKQKPQEVARGIYNNALLPFGCFQITVFSWALGNACDPIGLRKFQL